MIPYSSYFVYHRKVAFLYRGGAVDYSNTTHLRREEKMSSEKTLVIIKPHAVRGGLVGEIIKRLENRGLTIGDCKFVRPSIEMAREHYAEHKGNPYFDRITETLSRDSVMIMSWKGPNAIKIVRMVQGATSPVHATPGTVRGDFGNCIEENLMHASDSNESAEREVFIWF